ncbi:SDR family NAD(P)-dependent oxidoreductase [Atlantibacter hermannii]|uniref:Gluconate 5-dehydrogenase n=1 Tax=Atlantibacter hermannii NBRC 105704 TaxID=1115512 RepID=H5V6A6_ATLHE|nr:SDR family oxidoreductase [Atlantibacter hermannii]MDU7811107.1 SDR family oxidoreductase [Atlantibacter hermannii]QPS93525.1 SDR family oxidoreductase [Atlantibacter hermannii]WIF56510.1 SDR family oxidoreductase [Atlantibacter hermannii]VDZ73637.1 5-keto-D-gluconate 5-reductase [Atlantibacter hermannii]GAB53514.1 gluconate 5-dehydrogenase [Atlantibacter hermannii NBRC 105704]
MQPATLFDLTGKTALVTGGGSGIGAAMAHALAGSGANVILAARREGQLAEAAQRLNAAGGEVRYVCADLTRQPDIAALAEQSGPVDILVNAAGVNLRQPFEEVSEAAWDQQLALHLKAPFFLTQALAPGMAQRGWGRIINIASLQSWRAFDNSAPYGAGKGGVVQLTRAIAQRWGRDGVTCNAIGPGFFPTALTGPVFGDPALRERHARNTCLGRNGELEDLFGVTLFLASNASAYITGQTLMVDGGYSAI